MAFKKQLVTSCKQAIWGEILGGNAPNYANKEIKRILSTKIVFQKASKSKTFFNFAKSQE